MAKTPAQLDAEIANVTEPKCTTCGRPASSPYRRSVGGKIVEGCIDDVHTGHLYGSSLEWHNRPSAKEFRKTVKARIKEMLKGAPRGKAPRSHMDKSTATSAECKSCKLAGLPPAGTHRCRDSSCPYRHCDRCGALIGARVWKPKSRSHMDKPGAPHAPAVGQQFKRIGDVYEVVRVGRDKKRTVTLARRVSDQFGKEALIDQRTVPAAELERDHFFPVTGARVAAKRIGMRKRSHQSKPSGNGKLPAVGTLLDGAQGRVVVTSVVRSGGRGVAVRCLPYQRQGREVMITRHNGQLISGPGEIWTVA